MIEIIWHGRGGQGAFTAARLLGATASLTDTLTSLAFPSFGPERRGAPIRAFTKIDTHPIGDRSEVKRADYVVYLDETLFGNDWEGELKPNGKVLLNTKKHIEDEHVICIDASGIAEEVLGRNIPNTVFVAYLCKLSDTLSLTSAKKAIEEYMPEKIVSKNLQVVDYVDTQATFEEMPAKTHEIQNVDFSPFEASNTDDKNEERNESTTLKKYASANVSESETEENKGRENSEINDPIKRKIDLIKIPTLRCKIPKPEEFSHNTCWEAGFLTTRNSGWRTLRPVVNNDKCTGCLQCYMDCPDGCVFKIDNKKVAVDYDFCKGCGICAKACKFEAIEMIAERSED